MAMAEMRFISSVTPDTLNGRILQVNRSRLRVLHSRGVWFPLKRFDVEHRVTDLDGLPAILSGERGREVGSGRNAVK
jgi:hypothetical protein